MNEKNYNLEDLDGNQVMYCTFKIIHDDGTYSLCQTLVPKTNIDKENENNNYCLTHQKYVDHINKSRKFEIQKSLIKDIREIILSMQLMVFRSSNPKDFKEGYSLALFDLVKKLENGDFDE